MPELDVERFPPILTTAMAAELLHVHVNTVTQRLERVGQLIGTDWQQPERALEVQLALRLHRLRTGIGPAS